MNERIKELAEQASIIQVDGHDRYALPDEFAEQFAELIVSESILVMMENDYHGEWLGKKIKQHFGMKNE
jgi:5S rRNA maturation endonuclease (ribonuclease M5)